MKWCTRAIQLSLLLAGLALFPGLARADSDGYFCAAKGYAAVEFRSFSTPGLTAVHVLKIIRFGTAQGIHWAGELPLPDFQTHFMRCQAARVEIAGWGNRDVRYTIDVVQKGKLRIIPGTENSAEKSRESSGLSNLGLWSRPGTFPLQSDDPRHTYQIVCTVSDTPMNQAVKHDHKTEIVQMDGSGKVSQRLLIFEGTEVEPVD